MTARHPLPGGTRWLVDDVRRSTERLRRVATAKLGSATARWPTWSAGNQDARARVSVAWSVLGCR